MNIHKCIPISQHLAKYVHLDACAQRHYESWHDDSKTGWGDPQHSASISTTGSIVINTSICTSVYYDTEYVIDDESCLVVGTHAHMRV